MGPAGHGQDALGPVAQHGRCPFTHGTGEEALCPVKRRGAVGKEVGPVLPREKNPGERRGPRGVREPSACRSHYGPTMHLLHICYRLLYVPVSPLNLLCICFVSATSPHSVSTYLLCVRSCSRPGYIESSVLASWQR